MEVASRWENFQERKREASALIQTKIGRAGVQWIMEINQNDRNAAKKFWEYINAQGRKNETYQRTLTTQEGTRLEGEGVREYIRQTIEAAF